MIPTLLAVKLDAATHLPAELISAILALFTTVALLIVVDQCLHILTGYGEDEQFYIAGFSKLVIVFGFHHNSIRIG